MSTSQGDAGIFWRLFPDVRRGERERFLFFGAISALITLAQTVGMAGSDALFLAEFGPKALPAAFILASALTVTGSILYAIAVGRVRNDRLYVSILAGAALVLALGFWAYSLGARWVLVGFFCSVYVTQGIFLSLHYWTFAADYFDTLSSKRVFPLLVVSGSIGGILGGLVGLAQTRVAPTESLIITWAAVLLLTAGLITRSRSDLKRWFAVGAEADESSSESLQAARRFLQRSPLARWLAVSVVGMVLALFLMQYLEMAIFTEVFESPEALAGFFGIYLAVSNAIEIVVARVATPTLIRRLGVAQANLVHPIMTLLTFAALAVGPKLHFGIVARANRELMENALAQPVRALSYNALPFRFRGRMRALLEGMVFYAAMSIAGVALLLLGDGIDRRFLCAVGAIAALVYAAANLKVRREYLNSIVAELRRGRLDLESVGAQLGELEMRQLAEQWEASLAQELEPSRGWLELPPLLAQRGMTEPLRRHATHPQAKVRVACIEALAVANDAELPKLLASALGDSEPAVRLAAARAVARLGQRSEELAVSLRESLDDPDFRVRAEVALQLATEGFSTLREMAGDPDAASAVEALQRLPLALVSEARGRLDDQDPRIRATALDCVTRHDDVGSLTAERLERDLEHPDSRVRCAAARALGSRGDNPSAALLARALDDVTREVRADAVAALASMGEVGVRAALPLVESMRQWTADAALSAVARARSASSRRVLEDAFRKQVRDAWESRASLELVPTEGSLPSRFLHTALENALSRSRFLAFRTLALLEDPAVVRSARRALDRTSERERADALEVLSNLGDRVFSAQFALLLEDGPVGDRLAAVTRSFGLPKGIDDVVRRAENSPDRWLELAALGHRSVSRGDTPQEVRTMENLLALHRVSLFAHLSLEQLEAISGFMKEALYVAGELMMREGEPGNELHVLLEGEAQAFKNYGTPEQVELTTMRPDGVCYVGEIAILDRAPRSATVLVKKDARVLILEGERFMELLLQSPEIFFEVFRVLSQRLRTAEERLRAQEDEARASEPASPQGFSRGPV